jgi:hypothetical protein
VIKSANNIVDTYKIWAGGLKSHPPNQKGRFDGLVIIAKDAPHVPIPNTTVKPFSADGTKSQGLGE